MKGKLGMEKARQRRGKKASCLVKPLLCGPTEAARIMGYSSINTFKRKYWNDFHDCIRSVPRGNGTKYVLRDVFKAVYPEANEAMLDELITDHRRREIKRRLDRMKRRKSNS